MFDHHAVVCVGDSIAAGALPPHLQTPSLDVVHLVTDRLAIAAVRQLVGDAMVRPVTEPVRTFVIVARELPIESQNALLKLFEEPPAATRFVLIIPQPDVLLPTLRSRVFIVPTEAAGIVPANDEFQSFYQASYAERLETIAAWAKQKEVVAMEAVLRGAEAFAEARAAELPALLARVVFIRQYFAQSGAAKKMLMEELALQLPRA